MNHGNVKNFGRWSKREHLVMFALAINVKTAQNLKKQYETYEKIILRRRITPSAIKLVQQLLQFNKFSLSAKKVKTRTVIQCRTHWQKVRITLKKILNNNKNNVNQQKKQRQQKKKKQKQPRNIESNKELKSLKPLSYKEQLAVLNLMRLSMITRVLN